jgi:hypothetical protein
MTSTPNKRKNISLEEKYEIIKDKKKRECQSKILLISTNTELQRYEPLQREKTSIQSRMTVAARYLNYSR